MVHPDHSFFWLHHLDKRREVRDNYIFLEIFPRSALFFMDKNAHEYIYHHHHHFSNLILIEWQVN